MTKTLPILFFLVCAQANQVVLDVVNKYRAMHLAQPVQWNAGIESSSLAWAEQIARDGELEHSMGSGYGENLAGHYDSSNPINTAVDMWYSEVKDYDYKKPGFSMETGHFTQLVWNNTKEIGAAAVKGMHGMTYVVMQFSPPGNYYGQFQSNVFPLSRSPRPPPVPISKPTPPSPKPKRSSNKKPPPPVTRPPEPRYPSVPQVKFPPPATSFAIQSFKINMLLMVMCMMSFMASLSSI